LAAGKSVFYFLDLKPVVLADLVRGVVQKHPHSIVIVDGGFDIHEIDKAEIPDGAIFSADPSGRGYATERLIGDRYMGAFTSVLVRAIDDSPKGLGLHPLELFAAVSGIMRAEKIEPAPAIIAGSAPPVF
jgi:hypothetical protein